MAGTTPPQRKAEHRVLSLASSSVFLLSFCAFLYAFANRTSSSLSAFVAEYGVPLVFVPTLLPCFALVRLIRLRLLEKRRIPFFDGWFVHLAILMPYAVVFVSIVR